MPTSVASQVKRMAATACGWRTRYQKEKELFPFHENDETVLLPIRHFNSDHPVTPGEWREVPYNVASQPRFARGARALPLQPALVGGGYYIWHKGLGIAVDPGHGFVDSLHPSTLAETCPLSLVRIDPGAGSGSGTGTDTT